MIQGLALTLLLCINSSAGVLLEREIISVWICSSASHGAFGAFEYHHSCKPYHIRVISPWKYKIITSLWLSRHRVSLYPYKAIIYRSTKNVFVLFAGIFGNNC
jgi:hypothetical protein